MIKIHKNNTFFSKGFILVNVLVFGVIAIIVTTALVNWAATMLKSTRQLSAKEQAFQIAEAGIDYYRWHLAHASNDYKDGTGTTTSNGPFIHDFEDKDKNIIGQFALTITPPITGSTLTKIKSKGTVLSDPAVSRTIQVSLAIPSFAKYAVVANDFMNFGIGTEVFGPIHSNGGIHFDGLAHNVVTSAVSTFVDPDVGGTKYGVYTTSGADDPTPPTTLPTRADVFTAGRQFPVAVVDFSNMTSDISQIKTDARDHGGIYLTSSASLGYHIRLKTNDTFDLYKVTSLTNPSSSCKSNSSGSSASDWGLWTINTQVNPQTGIVNSPQNFPIPSNGLIFVEDNVWVDGQIDSARVTIVAGKLPYNSNSPKNIIVNNDLLYTNKDGQDAIALIAQNNIITGFSSDNSLEIDAALMAQNGRVGRYHYASQCGTSYGRSDITLYGMIATAQRYGFAWSGNSFNCGGSIGLTGGGYCTRYITYDANLLYAPPPSFPLASSQYITLSWEEVK